MIKKRRNHEKNQVPSKEQPPKQKLYNHKVMQMQSVYGNRALERYFDYQNNKYKDKNEVKPMPVVVPFYSETNKNSIGFHVYTHKIQGHQNHTLSNGDKKSRTKRTQEKEQGNQAAGHNVKDKDSPLLPLGFYSGDAPELEGNQQKEKEDAKKHLTQAQQIAFKEETYMEKRVKKGRFSSATLYPELSKILKRKRKREKTEVKTTQKRSYKLNKRFLG